MSKEGMKSPASPAASGQIRLSVSTILDGQFVAFNTPLPFASVGDVPKHLRKYVIKPQEESAQPQERNLAFSLHTSYGVDERGYRYLKREAAELAHQAIEQELIEEAIQTPLPPEIAQQIADQHEASVQFQIAQAQAAARRSDAAQQAACSMQEENLSNLDQDGFAPTNEQPTDHLESEPKPRKMRKRYLNRNGTWLRAMRVSRKKIGEPVYVRNGPNDFVMVGKVNSKGHLPAVYLEETA